MERVRVAIPVWLGRVSPVFDTARTLWVGQNQIGPEPAGDDLALDGLSAVGRVQRLRALEIDVLICAGISRPLMDMVTATGVHVERFVTGEVAEVFEAYLDGDLANPRFLMPGCQGRGRRQRVRHAGDGSGARGGGRGHGGRGGGRGRGGRG